LRFTSACRIRRHVMLHSLCGFTQHTVRLWQVQRCRSLNWVCQRSRADAPYPTGDDGRSTEVIARSGRRDCRLTRRSSVACGDQPTSRQNRAAGRKTIVITLVDREGDAIGVVFPSVIGLPPSSPLFKGSASRLNFGFRPNSDTQGLRLEWPVLPPFRTLTVRVAFP
jgi:hypothetical protein